MPKTKTEGKTVTELRGKWTTIPVPAKCKDCGADYTANKNTYENGDIVISPARCEPCQIAVVANLRVANAEKAIALLGNIAKRLNPAQKQVILDYVAGCTTTLADRYSGTAIAASAFDLRKVKA